MAYKVSKRTRRPTVTGRVKPLKPVEELTGLVRNIEASDIEERFARALEKRNLEFSFRDHYFGPARSTPGAIEIDFMVKTGGRWQPIQIDGEWAHKTIEQRAEDRIKDARINQYFARVGISHVIRIPDGKKYLITALDTQDGADRIVSEVFR